MRFQDLTAADVALQKQLLFIALWTPDDEPEHDLSVLELPHIREYFEDWGQQGDIGFFALDDEGEVMGIVQIRQKSCVTEQYAEVPELALAVSPDYRGQGIASALLQELFHRINEVHGGIRLGVHPKNIAAIALYEKFGFSTYDIANSGYLQMYRAN